MPAARRPSPPAPAGKPPPEPGMGGNRPARASPSPREPGARVSPRLPGHVSRVPEAPPAQFRDRGRRAAPPGAPARLSGRAGTVARHRLSPFPRLPGSDKLPLPERPKGPTHDLPPAPRPS